jgi:hypothetical protein
MLGRKYGQYKFLLGYPVPVLDLKGQSHEKVGEMSVWGISLGPN